MEANQLKFVIKKVPFQNVHNKFQKRASLTTDINIKVKNVNTVFGARNCHPGVGLPHHVISYYKFMMIVILTVKL